MQKNQFLNLSAYLLISFLAFAGCSKDLSPKKVETKQSSRIAGEKSIQGDWTLVEVYQNDHWGGHLHWDKVNSGAAVRFTSGGEYFKKADKGSQFKLIGTYEVGDTEIIVQDTSSESKPGIRYTLEADTLIFTYGLEGIAAEKFLRQ